MRRSFSVCILLILVTAAVHAQETRDTSSGLMRHSIDSVPLDSDPRSTPGGPIGKAPLATGYYAVDNDGPPAGTPWTPSYFFFDTTGTHSREWRRIRSGPNQLPMSTWSQPGSQGKEFFWNPSAPLDSTDNAFAGPISIGFPFYYYGRRYDSFYVSTNGLIALSNRRYDYNDTGGRIGYNPFRDDTLVRPAIGGSAQSDPTPDDYGWRYVALGNTTSPTGGLRNPNNRGLPDTSLRATIAPLWSDQELRQWNEQTRQVDDVGRVYWRRADSNNALIIYFVNMSMKGDVFVPDINVTATAPRGVLNANLQVILSRRDSSVQFNYIRFLGGYYDSDPRRSPFIGAATMHRANSTVGMQSNGHVPAPCTAGNCPGVTGTEYTSYLDRNRVDVNGDPTTLLHAGLAVWFRQWANKSRALSATFDVPSRTTPGTYVPIAAGDRHEDYELLLGDPLLGVMRPVGVVQNVSDSIGPVNRTPQPVVFDVEFRVRDIINCTAPLVYADTQSTRALHPMRVSTITSPSVDTVRFAPFVTNGAIAAQAGRFRAEVVSKRRAPGTSTIDDRWPFDDTTGVRIWMLTRQTIPYITTFDDFSLTCDGYAIPNVRKWVSIGSEVVDELYTYNPPPPRVATTGSNGNKSLRSPTLRMDRRALGGRLYDSATAITGDTLVSAPINIGTAARPMIIVNYQRSGSNEYNRGWSDQVRVGPEGAVYNLAKTSFMQIPDRLVVEFAEPSPNGVDNIVNARNWSTTSFGDTTRALTWRSIDGSHIAPRWSVFGGGGGSDTSGGIYVDSMDAGKDFRFYRAVIPISRRWSADANANRSFRFRVMLEGRDHGDARAPADDDDPFYIDNIYVTSHDRPEVEVNSVGSSWPYSIAPASQATLIPLHATVANNGAAVSTAFGVAMYIQNAETPPPAGRFNYYRFRSIISLGAGQEYTEAFPSWNAQECGTTRTNNALLHTTRYRISGQIVPTGFDGYAANDLTHTDFRLTLGPVFAYDDTSSAAGRNDVPRFSGELGRGLNLVPPLEDPGYPNPLQPYGPAGGDASGSFAARFSVVSRDTVYGFQAYYGSYSQIPERVQYALYRAINSLPNSPPDTVIRATRVFAQRGQGIPARAEQTTDTFAFDTYVTYMLPTPYVIQPGDYFVSVSQVGASGIELGGSARQQGQVTTIVDTTSSTRGLRNVSIPAHNAMRQQRFWFESGANTGAWHQMLQLTTNPGFPHLRYDGLLDGSSVPTYSRGSWIPMIRPYFGPRSSGTCLVTGIELMSFEVRPMASALRLEWRTASEINNKGFHIERRVAGEKHWSALAFIDGAGTINREQRYAYIDEGVERETTYQYRCRQEDFDGSVSYSGIREGRLSAAGTGTIAHRLEQNTPNPFADATSIDYAIAGDAVGTMTIMDLYGTVVRTYAVAGTGSILWDRTNVDGTPVANGVYVYKLDVDGHRMARKMTVVR